jgi:hypothetical protein
VAVLDKIGDEIRAAKDAGTTDQKNSLRERWNVAIKNRN